MEVFHIKKYKIFFFLRPPQSTKFRQVLYIWIKLFLYSLVQTRVERLF